MTYGIEIRNEFGERVVDFNRCFSIAETGNSQNWAESGFAMFSQGIPNIPRTDIRPLAASGSGGVPLSNSQVIHVMKSSVRRLRRKDTGVEWAFNWVPSPLVAPDSLYFFQLGSAGLLHHSEHRITPDQNIAFTQGQDLDGAYAIMIPFNNTSLPFIRVAHNFSGLSGGYGMQIRSEANAVLFDSRADFISVSEVLFVPRSTISNILINNAVVDISLRTSTPNAYFALPNHASYRSNAGGGGSAQFRHVRVRQTNSSTIQLRREDYGPGYSNASSFTFENDLVIIVARNPFA